MFRNGGTGIAWDRCMSRVLGIDLGTTNSCMAVMEAGEPVVIPNAEGGRTTPSVVAFTKAGERVVGQAAKRQAVTNPRNTIYSPKRLIGRKFSEIKEEAKHMPFKVVQGKNGDVYVEVQIGDKAEQFAPQQISAFVLGKMKADAEAYLGEKITVFDLGGGTFDVSVLEIGDAVFEVKATNGDTHLGGDNWDDALITWLVENFKKENGIDLRKDPMALQRLKEEAEKAKIALSSTQSVDINLPFITADAYGPKHLNVQLTRARMEQICDGLFERCIQPFKSCLKDADLTSAQIDELVLVGGMTRMPKVVDIAKGLGGKQPHQGVNPDEVVAVGAAIQGGVLKGEVRDVLLLDVTPLTLGIMTAGDVATAMIPRNTTIPSKKTQVFSTFSDNQPSVEIVVLQGERPMARDNKTLGTFRLDGIPPAPRGTPQIEVTFDIDANGILHVSAKDLGTGKDQKITIQGSSGLSKEEVEKMTKEAELNAAEDKKRRDTVEARNQLDTAVYQLEKTLKDAGDKLPAHRKSKVEGVIADAKKALDSNDAERIKAALESLSKAGAEFYAEAQAAAQAAQAAGGPGAKGGAEDAGAQPKPEKKADVVDADFEVVDDEKGKK